jgi:uncharacterized protein YqjF (DUF2071 family)
VFVGKAPDIAILGVLLTLPFAYAGLRTRRANDQKCVRGRRAMDRQHLARLRQPQVSAGVG